MGYFRRHLFFCTNLREGGRQSCGECGSVELRAYAKKRIKDLGVSGAGGVRVNTAGCLDRCEDGPVVVVYPEGVWYSYIDEEDLDEIIDSHLLKGVVVERLSLD